jgi:uncharacterized protein (DUF2249 family)
VCSQKIYKTSLLLLVIILYGVKDSCAQTFQWAKRMGTSTEPTHGWDVTTDAAGNSYTTGYFEGTVDFDPNAGIVNLTAVGMDAFVCKLNSAGNFVWVKRIAVSATTNIAQGTAIDVDNAGNIYVAGKFQGTADLDPGAAVVLVNTANEEVFVVKLNATGNFVWGRKFTGTVLANCTGIITDAAGNVHLGGYFSGTCDFDPGAGTYNLTSIGVLGDFFMAKLTSAGNLSWAVRVGGSNSTVYCRGIDVDPAGNFYATGDFDEMVDFNPGGGVFNMSAPATRAFVLKLNSSGAFVWAKQITTTSGGVTTGRSIAIDGAGYIYFNGRFSGTADLDPGAGVFNITVAGSFDAYVVKLNPAGNFIWGKRFGGTGNDESFDIALDNLNNVFITGRFQATVDFNPNAGTYNLTASATETFVCKLNSSGNFVWAFQIGGSSVYFLSINVDDAFNVYSTGRFSSASDFNPFAASFNMTAAGSWDVFIHKIGSPSPLPIELLSFDAAPNKNTIDLTWATATETNNDFFTIEKSKDGNKFEDVAKVDGAGNSNQVIEYSFTDKNPYNGLSYYRLKQTDFNGDFSYSKTVAVNLNPNNQFYLYQNPSANHIIVAFKNAETQPCKLLIHDVTGRMVHEQQITSATTILNFAFLPGVYVASVTYSQQAFSQKFIVR